MSFTIWGLSGGAGKARCGALAGGSCSEPILGFAGPQGSSIQSQTLSGFWAHALRSLWVALHVYIRICHRHIYPSSRSVYVT